MNKLLILPILFIYTSCSSYTFMNLRSNDEKLELHGYEKYSDQDYQKQFETLGKFFLNSRKGKHGQLFNQTVRHSKLDRAYSNGHSNGNDLLLCTH